MMHWRDTVERLAQEGHINALVAFDLDLKNMFGNIEWPRIRESIAKHMPDATAWVEWAHRRPAQVRLPGGGEVDTDRGAEQGDLHGSVQASLILGDHLESATASFQHATDEIALPTTAASFSASAPG